MSGGGAQIVLTALELVKMASEYGGRWQSNVAKSGVVNHGCENLSMPFSRSLLLVVFLISLNTNLGLDICH